jgi:hypothetical protein
VPKKRDFFHDESDSSKNGAKDFISFSGQEKNGSKISFHFLAKKGAGFDVMITIFCDFCRFSAKKLAFSQKPLL